MSGSCFRRSYHTTIETYTATIADDNLTLDFSSKVNRAKINAIEVLPANAARQQVATLEEELASVASLSATPNPFSDQTTIHFMAQVAGKGCVVIYDLNGSVVIVCLGFLRKSRRWEESIFHTLNHYHHGK